MSCLIYPVISCIYVVTCMHAWNASVHAGYIIIQTSYDSWTNVACVCAQGDPTLVHVPHNHRVDDYEVLVNLTRATYL